MKQVTLFLLLLLMAPLQAATIAFFNDYSANLASVEALKTEIRKQHTLYSAESIAAFEALFGMYPDIDVAILAIQDEEHTVNEFPRFKAFVENGGQVIFTDGSRSDSWEKFFGFAYSGNVNASTISFSNENFEALIGETSQKLRNPGYHVFSMGMKSQEVTLAEFPNGNAASLLLNGQVIINGFLLDTDSAVAGTISRALPRASSGSILLAQINFLQDPSLAAALAYGVPLDRRGMVLLTLIMLLGAVTMLAYRTKRKA